ncbi:carboxypeptidase-like regulatory domain-containing protein [Flavobacterium pallidum]|uniref:Carboxypeptidase-like regulatory domain-containing protein n=1 Tax=Flavobacterium pallidum TaxID=2172098 RepID=A0A2S1SFC9_9FLAO|nr:carboxypeptidase-like regulatory domain-containing protein [Flavobacterium pallidum]AWI25085.1 hypothetical protein HYN49_03790 [Flavobacterium pallidum]
MKNLKIGSWLCLTLLVSFSGFSQILGIVKDSLSGQPIPYINIWIENGNTGTTSEQDGTFSIQADASKNLVFTGVGYQAKTVKTADAAIVLLKEAVIKLDEVKVTARKPSDIKEIEIGGSEKIHHNQLCGATPWIDAKFFPFENTYTETPFIKNAIIFTESNIKDATFKLRIFAVAENGFPGADLVDEDIIISVKKGGKKNIVDLSKYHLSIPENGIFIGFEWMIIESNKYIYEYRDENRKKNSFDTYAPTVVCNPVEKEHTFRFQGGKWFKNVKKSTYEGKYKGTVIEPAINLTLTN